MEIKEEIIQLYYNLGEIGQRRFMGGRTNIPFDKTDLTDILNKIIELKKEIGEDYSYDEQLINQL